MILLIQYTLIFAAILSLVALGGCFSEHSGVINLGLEGVMVMGALGGALTMKALGSAPSAVVVIVTILVAALSGLVYTLLLAFACINLKADQTLVGTALNILATAAATVIVKAINMAEDSSNVSSTVVYTKANHALTTKIGGFSFNWFVAVAILALIAAYVILYKTRFGLRLMACGENPQAADSVGINVFKMRWCGVLISGSQWKFETGVAGWGFLALAVMIFGQWKPLNIGLAALLFGFFRALSSVYSGIGWLASMKIPSTIYVMLPYIISLIVLAFTSKNSRAPKAEGIPYDKSTR